MSTISTSPDAKYVDFDRTASPTGNSYNSLDETIPPEHEHRTLILCFDGTGDQFDSDNSNVVNFFATLKKDDCKKQLVYYQAGIGTYVVPQVASPMTARFNKIIDSMVGVHLNAHVMDGYEFIMQNYEAEDKICIFGFSRGAYTARALAGMIHKVGLLPRCNHQQVPFAYKMYSREDDIGWKQSAAFKKAFSIDVDIEFLGVWDTVGSVGIIPRRLPFTASNTHVRHFRHALALDERRVRFIPTFWHRQNEERGVQPGEMPRSRRMRSHHKHGKSQDDYEVEYEQNQASHPHQDGPTDIEEVWFAGCHCDVGGGAVPNEVRNSLSKISLRWMIRECFKLNTGIMFHAELIRKLGIEPANLYPIVKPRPAGLSSFPTDLHLAARVLSEEEEDAIDALCPMFDQLKIAKAWWLLELVPSRLKYQRPDNTWEKAVTINRGRPRYIPRQHHEGMKIHRSVKFRMENDGGKYKPRPFWKIEPTWVD